MEEVQFGISNQTYWFETIDIENGLGCVCIASVELRLIAFEFSPQLFCCVV